ncbi:MAG: hypothetical protein Q4D81_04505 [Eubacteriales bacterium]|nr:hypothetical protein [Eubacteriales bacterium]
MEIERKWMVSGWPQESLHLPLVSEHFMRQGYISTRPTVRIREEAESGGSTAFILCFKSAASADGLSRREVEIPVPEEHFRRLENLIGIPLIEKVRRTYLLPDGLHLEVNLVDSGLPSEFMYAEIEYVSGEQAENWVPSSEGLAQYLAEDVTGEPGQTMGAFWESTRLSSISGTSPSL